jgi:hypothetical protein
MPAATLMFSAIKHFELPHASNRLCEVWRAKLLPFQAAGRKASAYLRFNHDGKRYPTSMLPRRDADLDN